MLPVCVTCLPKRKTFRTRLHEIAVKGYSQICAVTLVYLIAYDTESEVGPEVSNWVALNAGTIVAN